jgi:hypothetical protein
LTVVMMNGKDGIPDARVRRAIGWYVLDMMHRWCFLTACSDVCNPAGYSQHDEAATGKENVTYLESAPAVRNMSAPI